MSVDPVSLAIEAALIGVNMALTASQTFEGPRLDNLRVATADFGAQLNYVKGLRRISGVSCMFAEPLHEVKTTNKTKGGKYNEYKYYGTWAVVVCGHETEGVTRIWFDKQLVYDATSAGPITPLGGSSGVIASAAAASGKGLEDHIRIYTGAADQEPDPRMSATLDAEFGEGSTPAFRGVTYVMFEDVPLEKFGNRFPLVEVEVVTAATDHYPYDYSDTEIGKPYRPAVFGTCFSPDQTRFFWSGGGDYELVDVGSRATMISGPLPGDPPSVMQGPCAIGLDGSIYFVNVTGDAVVSVSPDGLFVQETIPVTFAAGVQVLSLSTGLEFLCATPGITGTHIEWRGTGYAGVPVNGIDTFTELGAIGWSPTCYVVDKYDGLWAVGVLQQAFSDPTEVYFQKIDGDGLSGRPGSGVVTGLPGMGSLATVCAVYSDAGDHFVLRSGGMLYAIDPIDFSIKASVAISFAVYETDVQLRQHVPHTERLWLGFDEYDLETMTLIRSIDPDSWGHGALSGGLYNPLLHAIITTPNLAGANRLYYNYLDRIQGDGVILADIVADVAERCGLESDEYDASALDQTITGYSWTQGAGKAILSPLLEVYDSYVRPHDFTLQFLKRGAASLGTIPVADMGAGGDTRYTVSATLDTDLPRRVNFTFADVAMDQQPNSVPVQRNGGSVDSARELSLDATTLVMTVDFGRQAAERYLRRTWYNAEEYETPLSRAWTKLEPGDVYTLVLDDVSKTAALESIEFGAGGVLTTKWTRDNLAIHTLSGATGAPADGYDPATVPAVGYTKGFVLDTPLLSDADEGLVTYVAAAPYSSDTLWPGAVFYEGSSATSLPDLYDVITSDAPVSWGTADDLLPDAATEVWDRGTTVTVTMRYGTLTSATEAEVENGANLALIGDEIVGFRDAVLVSDGVYELTGFLRGRRGTEWATDDHQAGERFVLLDDDLKRHVMGASDVGDTFYFKPVTAGGLETAGFVQSLTYSGASLKPYAPAHFEAERDAGSGDWSFSWIRRTRIGGAWRDFEDASLGEGSESYDLVIYDGLIEKRVINVSSADATYTAAQQTTDFGGPVTSLDAAIFQRSTTVGRGFGTTATF